MDIEHGEPRLRAWVVDLFRIRDLWPVQPQGDAEHHGDGRRPTRDAHALGAIDCRIGEHGVRNRAFWLRLLAVRGPGAVARTSDGWANKRAIWLTAALADRRSSENLLEKTNSINSIVLSSVLACSGSAGRAQTSTRADLDAGASPDSPGGGSSGSSSGIVGAFGDSGGAPDATFARDAGCATAQAQATRDPVYMLFVLDGSGSMSNDNKWAVAVPALESIFSDINKSADTGEGAGLIVFSDVKDGAGGPYPQPGVDIPIAFVGSAQLAALDNRLSTMPLYDTPGRTGRCPAATGELEAFTPASPLRPGGRKVLILITVGVPTDGCTPGGAGYDYATNTCVTMAAGELTKAAPAGPILTFVVGVGDFPSSDPRRF